MLYYSQTERGDIINFLSNLFFITLLLYIFIIVFTLYYLFEKFFMQNQQGSKLKLKQKLYEEEI